MNRFVNSINHNRITVIPRSAVMPLAIRKSNSGAGDQLFCLPHAKVNKQQIPRAKQLARGMTVSFELAFCSLAP
jgi:hypothetical protein